jgi:hypothetical protein
VTAPGPPPLAVEVRRYSGNAWAGRGSKRWSGYTVECERGNYNGEFELDAIRIYPPAGRDAW